MTSDAPPVSKEFVVFMNFLLKLLGPELAARLGDVFFAAQGKTCDECKTVERELGTSESAPAKTQIAALTWIRAILSGSNWQNEHEVLAHDLMVRYLTNQQTAAANLKLSRLLIERPILGDIFVSYLLDSGTLFEFMYSVVVQRGADNSLDTLVVAATQRPDQIPDFYPLTGFYGGFEEMLVRQVRRHQKTDPQLAEAIRQKALRAFPSNEDLKVPVLTS